MSCDGVPYDALCIEYGAIDAGAGVVRGAAVRTAGGDDAAVAAAQAAPHDLLERHVAGAAMGRGELRARAHHRRRAAHVELDRIAQRTLAQRGFERHRDASLDAGA